MRFATSYGFAAPASSGVIWRAMAAEYREMLRRRSAACWSAPAGG